MLRFACQKCSLCSVYCGVCLLKTLLVWSLYPCPHYTCLALMLPFAGTSFALLLSLQLHRSLGRPLFSLRLCSALGPLLRGNNNSELRLMLELLAGSLVHGGYYSCSYPAWGGRKASDSVLWRSSRWFWGTNCSVPALLLTVELRAAMRGCPVGSASVAAAPHARARLQLCGL